MNPLLNTFRRRRRLEKVETPKTEPRKKFSLGDKKKKSMRPGSPIAQALETDKKILDLHKEEVVEPKVENKIIKEEVIETPQDRMMSALDSQLSSMAKLANVDKPEPKSLVEQKMELMEKQMTDLRRLMLETSQSTIVNGLGAGSPGSGEVNYLKLDDVKEESFDKTNDGQLVLWSKPTRSLYHLPNVVLTTSSVKVLVVTNSLVVSLTVKLVLLVLPTSEPLFLIPRRWLT